LLTRSNLGPNTLWKGSAQVQNAAPPAMMAATPDHVSLSRKSMDHTDLTRRVRTRLGREGGAEINIFMHFSPRKAPQGSRGGQ